MMQNMHTVAHILVFSPLNGAKRDIFKNKHWAQKHRDRVVLYVCFDPNLGLNVAIFASLIGQRLIYNIKLILFILFLFIYAPHAGNGFTRKFDDFIFLTPI